ncbi:uncharacterized protein BCR38DRAFT_458638 [Pseudomassariella vexata]|uniref:DUF7137 domain-containing protein n=1 Tax=Pseudomassariella vexata TaxID=1141098 RepID=A0A1Y2DW95_9PEZI|nr:uncharacterized protein BCR38DRAFT_458638 [Pseudomassariella vexata]ORY63538.1 hypothetical protein BCR38DRAFT_458638 [Pseudomassariella vexata]
MKGPQSLVHLLTAAVALSSTVAAWPGWLPDMDTLIVRQDDATNSNAQLTTPLAAETKATQTADATAKETTTNDSDDVKTTNMNTAGITATATGTGKETGTSKTTGTKKSGTSSGSSKTTTFNADDPAGGITMITPAASVGTPLYKIGETITWVWNYTSLQGTPTAIDVLAACSTASQTVTLTQNMTFKATGTYTWDTNEYKQTAVQSPLLTEMYTLIIYDADSSPSATASPGFLATFNTFRFGMYAPKPYEPLGEWQCATCSAANGDLNQRAVGFALTMSIITVLSFTWFVVGFGAIL